MRGIILSILLISIILLSSCVTEKTLTRTVIQTRTVTQTQTITKTSTPKTVTITTTPSPPAEAYIITKNVSYKIIQKTESYWYFSWQVTVKNVTSQMLTIYVEIHFLDTGGFSIDWTNDIVDFMPMEEKVIRGEEMIDASIASNVVVAITDISLF